MAKVRQTDLERLGAVYVSFAIKNVFGKDMLKDDDLGKAVTLTGNNQVGPTFEGSLFLGKLVDLSLTDADQGNRTATVQVKGIMIVPVSKPFPELGDMVVCGIDGKVRKSSDLFAYNSSSKKIEKLAGDSTGRGTVISKNYSSNGHKQNGEFFCTVIL